MSKKVKIIIISIFILLIGLMLYVCSKNFVKSNDTSTFLDDIMEIDFVRTYSVDYILDYTDNTGKFGYIIVNQFQMDMPTVMKIGTQMLQNIEMGNNYEFSFHGKKNNNKKYDTIYDIINSFELTSIVPTTKNGLEQRQDSL